MTESLRQGCLIAGLLVLFIACGPAGAQVEATPQPGPLGSSIAPWARQTSEKILRSVDRHRVFEGSCRAVATFSVNRDGHIGRVGISRSTCNGFINNVIRASVSQAAPFAVVPPDHSAPLVVSVPVRLVDMVHREHGKTH